MSEYYLLELLEALDEGFGELQVPAEDNLVYDNSGGDPEYEGIRLRFRGKHWRQLSDEEILVDPEALALLTDEAFRFFLPAFIRVSLLKPERADLIPDRILWSFAKPDEFKSWEEKRDKYYKFAHDHRIPQAAIDALAPTYQPRLDAKRRGRIAALSDAQRRVVRGFVKFLEENRGEEFDKETLKAVEYALSGRMNDGSEVNMNTPN